MKKILIFVASGFSTRMGGFPKALAQVDGTRVILNAINNAERYYDDIYIICNPMTKPNFEKVINEDGNRAKVREILTGKGDAESVWKSLVLVQNEIGEVFDATFCWGDAFFATDKAFSSIISFELEGIKSIVVGCSDDKDPYAYFDVYTRNGDLNKLFIKKSYFKKKNGSVKRGIHDQCIFRCISSVFIGCLNRYRNELGFDGENYLLSPTNEMGLLNSFTFLDIINRPASICIIPSGNVFSFNTQEELESINKMLKKE